jgi:hypothetical protein
MSRSAKAVTITIGSWRSERIWRAASTPSSSGIRTSMSTMSGSS